MHVFAWVFARCLAAIVLLPQVPNDISTLKSVSSTDLIAAYIASTVLELFLSWSGRYTVQHPYVRTEVHTEISNCLFVPYFVIEIFWDVWYSNEIIFGSFPLTNRRQSCLCSRLLSKITWTVLHILPLYIYVKSKNNL